MEQRKKTVALGVAVVHLDLLDLIVKLVCKITYQFLEC